MNDKGQKASQKADFLKENSSSLGELLLADFSAAEKEVAHQFLGSGQECLASQEEAKRLQNWKNGSRLRWVLAVCLVLVAFLSPWIFLPMSTVSGVKFLVDEPLQALASEDHQVQESAGVDERTQLIRDLNWQALHEREPENPLWFSQAMAISLSSGDSLPENWQKTLAKIDPENGLLLLAELGMKLEEWEDQERPIFRREQQENEEMPRYHIEDEQRFGQSLDSLYEILAYERLDDYSLELMSEIISHSSLVKGNSTTHPWHGQIAIIGDWAYLSVPHTTAQLKLINLLAAEAQRAADAGETEAFLQAFNSWRRFIELSLNRSSSSLIDSLVTETSIAIAPKSFEYGANQLELEQASNFSKRVKELVEQRREMRKQWKPLDEASEYELSLLNQIAIPATAAILDHQQDFLEQDYKPSTALERSFVFAAVSRAATSLHLLLFLVGVGYLIWVRKGLKQQLAKRLMALMSWREWLSLWLFIWALPLILFALYRYLPGLSSLRYNFHSGGGVIADFFPLILLPCVSLLGAVFWAKWFLRKHSLLPASQGWQGKLLLMTSFGAVFLLVLALSYPHLKPVFDRDIDFVKRSFLPIGVFSLLLIVGGFISLLLGKFSFQQTSLPVVISAQCAPLILATWIVSFSLIEFSQWYEAWYWLERDETLFSLERKTMFEADLVSAHLRELRALWSEAQSDK